MTDEPLPIRLIPLDQTLEPFHIHYEATGDLDDRGLILVRVFNTATSGCVVRINGKELTACTDVTFSTGAYTTVRAEQVQWERGCERGKALVEAAQAAARLVEEANPPAPSDDWSHPGGRLHLKSGAGGAAAYKPKPALTVPNALKLLLPGGVDQRKQTRKSSWGNRGRHR